MSLLSSCETLKCNICPFMDCFKAGTKPKCFLDRTLLIWKHIFDDLYHPKCPLLDGRKVEIRSEQGMLLIERDYV